MQKHLRNFLVLLLPILLMIGVNESMGENSRQAVSEICTWQCHNSTAHCKQQHVVFLKESFEYSDPVYFGIINSLKATGDYGLANILILALGFPLLIYYLLIRLLDVTAQIRAIKSKP